MSYYTISRTSPQKERDKFDKSVIFYGTEEETRTFLEEVFEIKPRLPRKTLDNNTFTNPNDPDDILYITNYPFYLEQEETHEEVDIIGGMGVHRRKLIQKGMNRHPNLSYIRNHPIKWFCPKCKDNQEYDDKDDCPECETELVPKVYGPFKKSEMGNLENWFPPSRK